MQNQSFSPGPWHVGPTLPIVWDKDGRAICEVIAYHDKSYPQRSRSHARLIAAAPDMLDALRDGIDALGQPNIEPGDRSRVLEYMRAAIIKAEGGAA